MNTYKISSIVLIVILSFFAVRASLQEMDISGDTGATMDIIESQDRVNLDMNKFSASTDETVDFGLRVGEAGQEVSLILGEPETPTFLDSLSIIESETDNIDNYDGLSADELNNKDKNGGEDNNIELNFVEKLTGQPMKKTMAGKKFINVAKLENIKSDKLFTKVLDKQIFKIKMGKDNDEVIVGDEKNPFIFYPQIKFTKWNNEESLIIKYTGLSGTATNIDGKIIISDTNKDFYAFQYDTNTIKFGLNFKIKPTSNTFTFQLKNWENFDFFYQPPLANINPDGSTWENNATGHYERPAETTDSYSIYHKTKKNYRIGGIDYGNGYAFHLKRSRFVDADGKWVWGHIEIKDGLMTETCPQEFLDNGKYPIRSNATFGDPNDPSAYSSVGYNLDQVNIVKFSLSEAGDVTNILLYCKNGGSSINDKGLIFDDDGASAEATTLKGATNATSITSSSAGWVQEDFATPVSLTAGDWWLGQVSGGSSVYIYYTTATGYNYRWRGWTGYYNTPVNWDPNSDSHIADTILAIKATYTPAGASTYQPRPPSSGSGSGPAMY